MPNFTLHRNFTLRTTKGHTINFVKGQPIWVPPACVPDAVAIGAVSEEEVSVLGDEPKPVTTLSPDERQKKLFAAFETLLSRNERGDFSASGLPNTRKLEDLCGFDVPNRERDAAWQAYSASKTDES
jgi:hypothetical protein